MDILRMEHPNPQWERENWQNLNGQWEFDFDFGRSAIDRGLPAGGSLPKTIRVPFCPESRLSGIGYTDFIPAVVYRKVISLEKAQLGGRVILHFGAVDYKACVFVNGVEVCRHEGGYTPFHADITDQVTEGENVIFVYAEDDPRNPLQCSGKQSKHYASAGCDYTRVTGIWQTVWLEYVPKTYIQFANYQTDPENGYVIVTGKTRGSGEVLLEASFAGEPVGTARCHSDGCFTAVLKLSKTVLWEVGKGNLYGLTLRLGEDRVHSYFGLRRIDLSGMKFLVNGKPVFQRLVLDQGYYQDGIYTAPSDAALAQDIRLSMAMGFNGARLHQKVFEPRFLYHCDRMGYIVWEEYGTWGLDHGADNALTAMSREWMEVLQRDRNHPAVIGWCPFNETWDYVEEKFRNKLLSTMYRLTKSIDPSRPCIDTSGNYHVETDIFDVHDYESDPSLYPGYYEKIAEGIVMDQIARHPERRDKQKYTGGPVFVSEYGGIGWDVNGGWGYGNIPQSQEAFVARYKGLTDALLDNPLIMGFCYTQLYDIEQEQNGLYTYQRQPKFDPEIFRAINAREAAMEKA